MYSLMINLTCPEKSRSDSFAISSIFCIMLLSKIIVFFVVSIFFTSCNILYVLKLSVKNFLTYFI